MSGSKKRKRDEGDDIAEEIQWELQQSGSDSRWGGAADTANQPDLNLDVRSYRMPASHAAKQAVQVIGAAHGCHTCLTSLAIDRDQPWIGDHCPPTELDGQALNLLGINTAETYLFPQCHDCSQRQAALTSQISRCSNLQRKTQVINNLTPFEQSLFTGTKTPIRKGRKGWNCLVATSTVVKDPEGIDIQLLGRTPGPRGGCHTCGTRAPVSRYIADHWVPAAFVTTGMQQLFALLGIGYPLLQLRPQCTRCSTAQGGHVQGLVNRAIAYGTRQGIVFTERM